MRDIAELPARTVRFTQRQLAARRLGMPTRLFRDVQLPERVRCGERWLSLEMPQDDRTLLSPLVEVLIDDCYGLRRLKQADRILDIGGNVGLFSVAARIAHPSATIHAYEPNPRLWEYLRHQAAEAGFTAFPEAVGGSQGLVSMEYRESGDEGSIHSRTQLDEQGSVVQVPFELAVERMGGVIDLAKVDCEGAEWSFLDSPAWSEVARVAMEYHLWSDHTHREARDALRRLGFRIIRDRPADHYGILWGVREAAAPGGSGSAL
jgi:FkbM family methyltransferase